MSGIHVPRTINSGATSRLSQWPLPDLAFVDDMQAAGWRAAIASRTAVPVS